MRDLAAADIPALERILRDTGAFTATEVECAVELLEIIIREPGQLDYAAIVADPDGEIAGYILYGPVPLTAGTYEIYWLATAPAKQGNGIGRELMAHVEAKIRGLNGRLICLETSSQAGYRRTRRFYEQAGYRQEAQLKDFYRPGDDRITFIKRFQ